MFNHTEENNDIRIDDIAKAHILEIGRWGKFLAIVGFIMMGLFIVLGLVFAVAMPSLPVEQNMDGGSAAAMGMIGGGFVFFVYVILAAIYFYPTWALYKYAVIIKRAIANNDQQQFNYAFGYLKGCFKYMGIVMIIILCIYAMFALFGGLAAVVAGLAA